MAKKKQPVAKPRVPQYTYPVDQNGTTGYTDSNGTWHPGRPPGQ